MIKKSVYTYAFVFIFISFLMIFGINVVTSETQQTYVTCNSVVICPDVESPNGNYVIECSIIKDGYCPYRFADWDNLDDNQACNEFTDKCEICDPDCSELVNKKCFTQSPLNLKEVQVKTGR